MGKSETQTLTAIGLMSGTSMDGIDVALLKTNGGSCVERGPVASYPYEPPFQEKLRQAVRDAKDLVDRKARPGCLREVEAALTVRHAAAVQVFLDANGFSSGDIDVVGFHGQTVLHAPERGLTLQLGDGHRLAELTGIDVVYDLRAADCAAGGQGAPLAPAYHAALAMRAGDGPAAFVNVGGVANITFVRSQLDLRAFDVGPGNALIDDWIRRHSDALLDEGGRVAAAGRVDDARVTNFFRHPFFAEPGPKSLDRDAFSLDIVDGLSLSDGAATLTAITAEAIARARTVLPQAPAFWVVSGGGRKNKTLMQMIAARVENAVLPVEAIGVDGDSVEAEAWAYLAVRSRKSMVITWPGTTGVSQPMTGGVLALAPVSE